MNKKEINELKKRFSSDHCSISALCGCYVNGEKEKVTAFRESFLMLEEEERHKYFEIFKKAMSGQFGKNLFNLEFPLEAEEAGGAQALLMELRKTKLCDENVLDEFYTKVIENFTYDGNYLILLIFDSYDVPGKGSDGITMEDASEEVFQYVLCCVCPVNLAKPALCYDSKEQKFHHRTNEWILETPQTAFLFPAFNDRSTDIHQTLYYSKNIEDVHDEFIDGILAGKAPVPATSQKEIFQAIVTETLAEECTYSDILDIQDTLSERAEAAKEIPQPLELTKSDIKDLLLDSGITSEKLANFDMVYDTMLPEHTPLVVDNLMDTKKVEVKSPNILIRVKPEAKHLLKVQQVDGQNCIVIEMDEDVSINGIPVSSAFSSENE